MAGKQRVVLVDGSWLIFRAFFAIPSSFMTSSGLHTNAIYGFASMFRKLLAGRPPDLGAVVFDPPGATFRDEKFPEYKANRPPMDDSLREQLPWIDRVVAAHNFRVLRYDGYEADDVIGTLSRIAGERGHEVFMVSGDKDFAQLVTDDVRMWDTMRDVVYDPALVRKKWGVHPRQIPDLLALCGDKIDNIPGVPGVGQKTAEKLLEDHGDLAGIYARLDEGEPAIKGKLRERLSEHRAQAKLSLELATIDRHVDLQGLELEDLRVTPPEAAVTNALFKSLEFYSLLSRDAEHEASLEAQAGDDVVCRSLEAVREAVAGLEGVETPIALHLLMNLEKEAPRCGGLCGVAMAVGEQGIYVPIEGPAGSGLGQEALEALRGIVADASRPKVVHDARVLHRELARRGLELAGVVGDTRLGSFLVNPTRLIPHDLPRVVKEYLHHLPPDAKAVVGSGKSVKRFAEVSLEQAAGYACRIARDVAALWPLIEAALEGEGQLEQLRGHDLPLAEVLAAMELRGVKVDVDDLAALGQELREQLATLEGRIYEAAGRAFNIGSPKQLGEVLFDELKLPVIKRTKTGYSTAQDVLERLAEKGHGIATDLIEHRKVAKLINTYTDVLQAAVDPSDGRVHASFQQTVSATGRLITTDPDLQRTPVRSEEGERIRRAFVAEAGNRLISADWSQIELRLLAHFSGDPRLVEAFSQELDVHARTAAELFSVPVESVTRSQRGVGKLVNFATIYGQGATALSQILKIERSEASAYIERFFEVYGDVRRWLDATIAGAHERGYVETILGRRRYIPELTSNNPMDRQAGERIAANTPIQGSAADLCKLVMLEIPRRLAAAGLGGTRMILQIHDELLLEGPESEVEAAVEVVRACMERPVALAVPLRVEVGVGGSWGEAH